MFQWIITIDMKKLQGTANTTANNLNFLFYSACALLVAKIDFLCVAALEDDVLDLLTRSVVNRLSRLIYYVNALFPNDDYQPPAHTDRKKKWVSSAVGAGGALPMQVHRKPVGQKASRVKVLQKLGNIAATSSKSIRH